MIFWISRRSAKTELFKQLAELVADHSTELSSQEIARAVAGMVSIPLLFETGLYHHHHHHHHHVHIYLSIIVVLWSVVLSTYCGEEDIDALSPGLAISQEVPAAHPVFAALTQATLFFLTLPFISVEMTSSCNTESSIHYTWYLFCWRFYSKNVGQGYMQLWIVQTLLLSSVQLQEWDT